MKTISFIALCAVLSVSASTVAQVSNPPTPVLVAALRHLRPLIPVGPVALESNYFADVKDAATVAKAIGAQPKRSSDVRACRPQAKDCELLGDLVGALSVYAANVSGDRAVVEVDVRTPYRTPQQNGMHSVAYVVTLQKDSSGTWRVVSSTKKFES